MKAFAYLRVSGKGQVDGDGFDRQLSAIESYARSSGTEIVQVFREEGVAGAKDLDNRPALLALLDALMSNGVRTFIIEKLDRLARDLMIQESILADMKKRGIEVISAHEPDLCSDDPSRKLFRQMMGAFAEYEKSIIVLKLRGARGRVKAATGRCEGRKPYGMKDGESAALGDMIAMRKAGRTLEQIAAHLNSNGIPSRQGGQWKIGTISQILGRAA